MFTIDLPPTPKESTTHPVFPAQYDTPIALTHSHAASGVQPLSNGRLLYTESSYTSPNDVFIVRGLNVKETPLKLEQVTKFTAESLDGKDLEPGESFWFKGAEDKQVQGWAFKPKGWKEGVKKSVPVILFIHGGPQGAWEDQWSTRWNPNGRTR